MNLKRIYDTPDGWEKRVNARGADGALADPGKPEGICLNPPPLAYVALGHTGVDALQKFSAQMVAAAAAEGWLRIDGDKLVLDVHPEPLVYTILRAPGRYCLHCGEKLHDDEKGNFARAHIAMKHAGVASPDPANPAGYEALNAFECELDPKQHAKFRAPPPGRAIRYHLKQNAEG